MKEKKSLLLQTVKQMNIGVSVCGIGFLLYLAVSAMEWWGVRDLLAVIFGLISVYVFLSVACGREKDKEAVSYNLLWGSGALTIMLCAFAVLGIKVRLGL